jgi:hypothetical protein
MPDRVYFYSTSSVNELAIDLFTIGCFYDKVIGASTFTTIQDNFVKSRIDGMRRGISIGMATFRMC